MPESPVGGGTSVKAWQERGRAAALGRRPRVARVLRYIKFGVLQVAVKLHRRYVASRVGIGWLEYHPAASSPTEHADISARAWWYLADLDLPVQTTGPPFTPEDAPWMDPKQVRMCEPPQAYGGAKAGVGHRLIHRATVGVFLRALVSRSPMTIVDANVFGAADCWGYEQVRRTHAAVRPAAATQLHPRLRGLIAAGCAERRTALIVATGPSADELDLNHGYDVRITCNSAVRNIDLLQALRPDIIVFADPVFHFGPSRYAAAFRDDARKAVELTNALLLVPAASANLLLHHSPELAEHVVPFTAEADGWSWPTLDSDHVQVRRTDNVLTLAMLPAAFAVAAEIHIAGSDGRAPGERYFWRHNARLQYSDKLMETVFTAHPGFFRDRVYADYYASHCRRLDELIAHGEQHGKTVRGVTPSYIPALQQRGAVDPAA